MTLGGQQSVLRDFSAETRKGQEPQFSTIKWDSLAQGPQPGVTYKSQIVTNEEGDTLYTLKESTETFGPPKTVKNSVGQDVLVSKNRIVDMPGDGDLVSPGTRTCCSSSGTSSGTSSSGRPVAHHPAHHHPAHHHPADHSAQKSNLYNQVIHFP